VNKVKGRVKTAQAKTQLELRSFNTFAAKMGSTTSKEEQKVDLKPQAPPVAQVDEDDEPDEW